MRARSQKTASHVAGIAVLAVLAVILLSGFVHTDDGCAVERHCLACRFVLSPSDGTPAPVAAHPFLETSRGVDTLEPQSPAVPVARALASRGPPPA